MRLSRPCYDKAHRCPGWAGGGMLSAQKVMCQGGHILIDYDNPWWRWKTWDCDTCNIRTLPNVVRYIDPKNIIWEIKFWWRYRRG